ncbi:hypothetical protein TARUN_5728 [Trichoderma arundinaceum]|uniref:Uncharacterized protein n=1 Tax=Trichoderma arundinaceum TaxID=490622 RepID=A0A395NKS2_TRIAR|nr:hypothetical protein TARUN_5728 [Trichoderma arundinaceum]
MVRIQATDSGWEKFVALDGDAQKGTQTDRDADASRRAQHQAKAATWVSTGRRSEWHGGVVWAQSQANHDHVPTTAVPAPEPRRHAVIGRRRLSGRTKSRRGVGLRMG